MESALLLLILLDRMLYWRRANAGAMQAPTVLLRCWCVNTSPLLRRVRSGSFQLMRQQIMHNTHRVISFKALNAVDRSWLPFGLF
jgi:hypothetical protein